MIDCGKRWCNGASKFRFKLISNRGVNEINGQALGDKLITFFVIESFIYSNLNTIEYDIFNSAHGL